MSAWPRHQHRFVWLGWLRNDKLPSSTIEARWCGSCGTLKVTRWIKGIDYPKTTRPGKARFVNTLIAHPKVKD